MAERPIIFSAPMVRAIIEGRKTQTRRIVKPQPVGKQRVVEGLAHVTKGMNPADDGAVWYVGDCIGPGTEIRCPYGVPGDALWVKEAHRLLDCGCRETCRVPWHVWYDADESGYAGAANCRLRPSIHMPRWACRLTLAVKAVRVERLQEITEADAIAEGVQSAGAPASLTNVGAFAKLWDSINGTRHPWASNPWVWVVEFEPEVRS